MVTEQPVKIRINVPTNSAAAARSMFAPETWLP